jgi:hypothetical protein
VLDVEDAARVACAEPQHRDAASRSRRAQGEDPRAHGGQRYRGAVADQCDPAAAGYGLVAEQAIVRPLQPDRVAGEPGTEASRDPAGDFASPARARCQHDRRHPPAAPGGDGRSDGRLGCDRLDQHGLVGAPSAGLARVDVRSDDHHRSHAELGGPAK